MDNNLMEKIISLSKQRGFIFQSSEIYGGLKSAYDYGPLGVELKRNIMNEWWKSMVHEREDVIGIDASIIMHSDVWEASGHLAGFSDPLVDCLISKERFRADKAPKPDIGDKIMYVVGAKNVNEISRIRKLVPNSYLLIPGVGAQGGSLKDICENGLDNGLKLLVNSSRSILYSSNDKDYSKKAMEAASKLQNEMKEYMLEKGLIQ